MIYSQKELDAIRAITLDQYFAAMKPDDIIAKGNGRYDVKWNGEWHTSLSIVDPCERYPHGYWSFFSQGESGHGALDWLCRMEGMSFAEACQTLVGPPKEDLSVENDGEDIKKIIEEKFGQVLAIKKGVKLSKTIDIPKKVPTTTNARVYLASRGIDPAITDYSIRQGYIYEDDRKNCVFVGFDMQGFIKYANKRGTVAGSSFKGEARDSDKAYSFRFENPVRNSAHFFESAIDTLSYATYMKQNNMEWRLENLISLGGIAAKVNNKGGQVYEDQEQEAKGKLPVAMEAFLQRHPGIKVIHLHLDNDLAGRKATAKIQALLEKQGIKVLDEPSPVGKDWNDYVSQSKETQPIEHTPDVEEETHGERNLENQSDN